MGLFRDIGKSAVAIVAIKNIRSSQKIDRRAICRKSLLNAGNRGLDGVVEVVHHEKVEQPIVVVIEPSRRHRPRLADLGDEAADASLLGHIREGAVSIVMEKLVAVDAGHVKIDKSVVVVVAGRYSHRIADALQSGLLGYIGEGAVSVVAVEPVVVTGIALFQRRNGRAIGKENVEQAVVVVVEDRDSAHHCFKRVALRTDAVPELELDLRLFDDVLELDGRCGWRDLTRRLFAGSRAVRLRCRVRRGCWNRSCRSGLRQQAGSSPQQAQCQLNSYNEHASSRTHTN